MTATPTPSLQRRVTGTVLGLFALLLVLVGVLVDVALGARLTQDLDARLSDRLVQAQILAEQGASPPRLVSSLQGQDIRVRVVTSGGDSYGDPGLGPLGPANAPSPPVGPGASRVSGAPGPPQLGPSPPDATSTSVTRTLPGGDTIVLVADTTAITDVRSQLRLVMLAAGAAALVLAALVLLVGVRTSLRPLDRLTSLARRITAGDRGTRLDPDRRHTELGRAATAFDDMLDALEDAESRARAAAREAQRSAAETRGFLSDAAHELRTPLTGIGVVAESLAAGLDPADEHQQRRARLLVRETGRAGRLVSDMLDLARIEEGVELRTADTDLMALIGSEVTRARELSPRLDVEVSGPAHVPVRVDAMRISQILTNLLDNARRHTPDGGRISVEAGVEDATVTVTVANPGPPVPEAERERIFGRLVRLQDSRDRDSGGAGLGLPVARGLARTHGGDLVCDARSSGAVFRLTLPAGTLPTETLPAG